VKLVALKPMRYAGRALVAGDEFEASEKDGILLKRIKRAGDPPAPAPAPESAAARPRAGVPRYSRRDMRAEEQ